MKLRKTLAFVFSCFLFYGCSDHPNEWTPTQRISGSVELIDSAGNQVSSDLAGIKVTEQYHGWTATTDKNGKWSFDDIDTGSYLVRAEKDGYLADSMWVSVLEGQGVGATLRLTNMPDEVVRLTVADDQYGAIWFSGIANVQPYFLIDRTPTARVDTIHLMSPIPSYRDDGRHFWKESTFIYESRQWRQNAGLKAGDTVYISACIPSDSSNWKSPSELFGGWFDHGGPKSNVIPVVLH